MQVKKYNLEIFLENITKNVCKLSQIILLKVVLSLSELLSYYNTFYTLENALTNDQGVEYIMNIHDVEQSSLLVQGTKNSSSPVRCIIKKKTLFVKYATYNKPM